MKVLVTLRMAGRPPARQTLNAEWLRVGRNASCEIHLPDPRVALEQGMVVNRDGLVYLEGEAGSQDITRKSVRSVRLVPGTPVEIGPYRIEAMPAPEGFDGALAVELARPAEIGPDLASRTSQLTLGSLGLTKRAAAWVWAALVLGLFLAFPAGRVLDLPWSRQAQELPFGDRFWNPGRLIRAHQPVEPRCGACHEVAFRQVRDQACLECHRTIGQHAASELRPAALFEGARCATCHREHKGVKATHRDDDGFCADCHGDIGARRPATDLAAASDFARDHPDFRLAFPTGGGIRRVRQGEPLPPERSNLAFPHDKHLDPRGVKSPTEGRVTLECAGCHQPDASGRGFEPVTMRQHCQECHRLQFEPAVTSREVPHGSPAQAQATVEEFYGNLALNGVRDSFQKAFGVPGVGLLRRPGEPTAQDREQALVLARRKADRVATELFEVRVCGTCHAVEREGTGWRVAPIRVNRDWMPRARFDHASHRQAPCADCHDVARSRTSDDVAMPAIAQCRECHGGSRPTEGKVLSNCMLCHGFHDARHPWDPEFRPRGARLAHKANHGP